MAVILQFVQLMLICSTTLCWGYTCSTAGGSSSLLARCGVENGARLDEAVAKLMANISLVFPTSPGVKGTAGCKSSCTASGVNRVSGGMDASAKVDQIIDGIKKLANQLEASLNKAIAEEQLAEAVNNFGKDRDWPKLKQALENALEPNDPVLDQAKDISWTDGKDALMYIVQKDYQDLLRTLLDLGLDANLPWGINNSTMLHSAAAMGNISLAELLLSRGAHVDALAAWNVTPLSRASTSNQPEMVMWLLTHGANVHASDTHLWTPLHFAAKNNDYETVTILLDYGASKEALNEYENTPYQEALDNGATSVTGILVPEDPFNNNIPAE